MPSPLGVAFVGHYERHYPRNVTIRRLLGQLGHRVMQCHSLASFPWRHSALARQVLRRRGEIDLIWAAEGSHRLMPSIRAVASRLRVPIVFDPFISRYNTRVEDRKLYPEGGAQAWIASWQDWSSCSLADHLVFDTYEHEQYFRERYRLRVPSSVIEVAVDEKTFDPSTRAQERENFEVLFYGTYIPLQGIDTIVSAAHLLRDEPGVQVNLIGRGQVFAEIERMVHALGVPNVQLQEPVSPQRLAQRIAGADLCLGIFGATTKAARVVPNKVVQCSGHGQAARDPPKHGHRALLRRRGVRGVGARG